MFTLNKRNGVLSSRAIVNAIDPGVYDFDMALKKMDLTLDHMRFRLIIIGANTSRFNFFKFDKEFYRFNFEQLPAKIKLIHRFAQFKAASLAKLNLPIFKPTAYDGITFKLISNKYTSLFKLDPKSGQLDVESVNEADEVVSLVREDLNEDSELTLYALALVTELENNMTTLEYMCEILVDFKSFLSKLQHQSASGRESNVRFSSDQVTLRINENLDTVFFRCLAFTTNRFSPNAQTVVYNLESVNFVIDEFSGELKIVI
jgi:hypothetical protein